MEEIYGKPFQSAISESGLKGVMPCYNSIDGEPASVSHRLLTELLREKMGLTVCVSATTAALTMPHEVQRIGETIGETGLLAMEAGMGHRDAESDRIWRRTQRNVPKRAGGYRTVGPDRSAGVGSQVSAWVCLSIPFAMDGESCQKIFEKKEGAELSLQSARESMVLLKNNGILPLSGKIKKLALIGPHLGGGADCARNFFGRNIPILCMMESV